MDDGLSSINANIPTPKAVDVRCDNCAFGNTQYGYFDGRCRRHAPKMIIGELGPRTMWPPVQSTDFCGDFVAKPSGQNSVRMRDEE